MAGHIDSPPAFLRYSIANDEWAELLVPPDERWSHVIIATDTAIVAYVPWNGEPAYLFDVETGEWAELPSGPMPEAHDRTMVWAESRLFLFNKEMGRRPDGTGPKPVGVAALDLGTGVWERLADSETLADGPWFVEDGRIINPQLGGADGGKVNNWGRTYPYGGIFDARLGVWQPLPDPPDAEFGGSVLGAGAAMFGSTNDWFLDLSTDKWAQLPELPSDSEFERRNVLTAGQDIISFGGERWATATSGGEVLGDAWMWRSGR